MFQILYKSIEKSINLKKIFQHNFFYIDIWFLNLDEIIDIYTMKNFFNLRIIFMGILNVYVYYFNLYIVWIVWYMIVYGIHTTQWLFQNILINFILLSI